jgi:AraC-like DNA-binding protein
LFDVQFRTPEASALKPLVTAFYTVEVGGPPELAVEDHLHPEWGNLRFQLSGVWSTDHDGQLQVPSPCSLFGPSSRARRIVVRPGKVQGIGFTPLGWARLVRTNAGALADRFVPASEVFGNAIEILGEALALAADGNARGALIEAFLLARLAGAPAAAHAIRLVELVADPDIATVEALGEAAGLSPARLSRACVRDFGFPPKLLLRRQRFLRTLAAILDRGDRPIGQLIDADYVDQPHFNREFRRFMGMTPRIYFARPRSVLRPAAAARERGLGAPLQALHQGG